MPIRYVVPARCRNRVILQSMQLEWSGLPAGAWWLVKVTVALSPPLSEETPRSAAFESRLVRYPQANSRGVRCRWAKRRSYAG
jgi:hypothetical protein